MRSKAILYYFHNFRTYVLFLVTFQMLLRRTAAQLEQFKSKVV